MALSILVAAASVLVAPPASAVYGFDNSQIVTKANSYPIGYNGGQCRVWAGRVIDQVLAENGIHATTGGYGSVGGAYYGAYADAGGSLIAASAAQPGDLVQIIEASQKNLDYPSGTLHTAIITGMTLTAGTFVLRDSNWGLTEQVRQHNLNPVTWAAANHATAYFWRFGTVRASSAYRFGSDADHNGGSDLIMTTNEPGGGSAALVALSTYQGFLAPSTWWADKTVGWSGITPLVGDVNGDGKADYVFVANNGSRGVRAYVALSTGSGFSAPQLWWDGTGYGYSGIKASLADVDGNGGADLILTTKEPGGGSAAMVLLSTYEGFLAPQRWWSDRTVGWSGITPLVGDVNGDQRADYIFLANDGAAGVRVYVALSTGAGFAAPTLWWDGSGYGYGGIKAAIGDVDGNGGVDLVLTTKEPSGGTAAIVLLSTYQSFTAPRTWWRDYHVDWNHITPLVGDLNGDHRADLVMMSDNGSHGVLVYASINNGSSFGARKLWLDGSGFGYAGIKAALS